jgi:hypothetical protein
VESITYHPCFVLVAATTIAEVKENTPLKAIPHADIVLTQTKKKSYGITVTLFF